MEDVGRVPTDLAPAPPTEPTTIPNIDGWIESLMSCKQLAESDVQRLCEKVGTVSGQGPSPMSLSCPAVQSRLCLGMCLLSSSPPSLVARVPAVSTSQD